MGVIKGDTRSLDSGSDELSAKLVQSGYIVEHYRG